MTNSKTRIDDYVRQVESHLKLRGRAPIICCSGPA